MEQVTHSVPLDRFPGKTLDGFLIEAPLGKGGMAAVFRAKDLNLDRTVALKVLFSDAVRDAQTRERFLSEARAAAAISHPNILQVHRAGEQAGVLYIAMEYVKGQTLDKVLEREGRFDPRRALVIAREVALALDAAHRAGLVHRDVKPANIMIGPDGHVTVMDFGVAKPMKGEVRHAREFSGTPEYASPEQHGDGPVDARSDLYALGVTLYQMLTGRLPFVGDTATTLRRRIAEEEPIAVRDLESSVPRPVAALVARLMAKRSEDRPSSAREVARELDGVRRRAAMRWPAIAAASVLILAGGAFASVKIRHWKPVEPDMGGRPVVRGSTDKAPLKPEPREPEPPVAGVPWTDRPTVMVAEFSPAEESVEWLPPALVDLLNRELAASGRVNVVPRSRACRDIALAENRLEAAEQAARLHGAQIVVLGEYELEGDRLTLRVELMRLTPEGPKIEHLDAIGLRRDFTGMLGPLAEEVLQAIEKPEPAKSGS